ncbi:MAG: right-handed parallel beta-helix repeat-containing protein, partial [Planctomycetota bacterium]
SADDLAGGGIFISAISNVTISNCIVSGNYSNGHGGGIFVDYNSTATVTNSLISNNIAYRRGGGILANQTAQSIAEVKIRNCTIVNNFAAEGGGICCYGSALGASIYNSILWGNNATFEGDQMSAATWTDSINLYDCDYQSAPNAIGGIGEVLRENCIVDDPFFVDSEAGNFTLQADSPCIDTGSNANAPSGLVVDLGGQPRFVDGNEDDEAIIDMGAYEYQP